MVQDWQQATGAQGPLPDFWATDNSYLVAVKRNNGLGACARGAAAHNPQLETAYQTMNSKRKPLNKTLTR